MSLAELPDDELLQALRTITTEELAPIANSAEHGRVSRDLLRALGTSGVLGLLFPSADPKNPRAATARHICLIREAIAYACTEAEVAIAMQGIGGYPILQSGQQHQRDQWLGPLRDGTAVAGFALTEPDVGSDAANLSLEAKEDNDGWTLHGQKTWITNAPDADFYVTFARTTPAAGARGVSIFLVPADSPGLTATPIEIVAAHPLGTLTFDGVKVTERDLIGEANRGFRVAMKTFDLFRPSVGAAVVGMAQSALDAAVERTSTRQAFGRALGSNQAVAHGLADASTRLQASRLLVADAANAYDTGSNRVSAASAMAKLFATESAQQIIDTAIQYHGASGLERGHLLEGLYREIRATRIYEGASEIQRDLIARDLFRNTPLAHSPTPRPETTKETT